MNPIVYKNRILKIILNSLISVAKFWGITDSLKYPTLRPFLNGPTNISWFGWTTLIVASLKRLPSVTLSGHFEC